MTGTSTCSFDTFTSASFTVTDGDSTGFGTRLMVPSTCTMVSGVRAAAHLTICRETFSGVWASVACTQCMLWRNVRNTSFADGARVVCRRACITIGCPSFSG